jgi:IMP dehydrogenase
MAKRKLLKDKFFEKMNSLGLAMTFDDVRLKTGYSKVMPDYVNIETKFSKNIPLKIPIVSAAMDTVTEHEMAIGLAKLGGLGLIHKGLNAEEQAYEVAKVKFHLNGLIEKPICFRENETIEEILNKKAEKGYDFDSFPILNDSDKLVGILTANDFDFCIDKSHKAKEIMTTNLITAEQKTTIKEAYDIMIKRKKKVLPLINEKNELMGVYVFSDARRIIQGNLKTYNADENGQLRVAAAIGVYDDAFERLEKLVKEKIDVVVIDSAHGDSKPVIETLKKIKKKYDVEIVAGNISSAESAERLIKAGADGIKIGQGPGAICTTRIIAGIGTPQLSAVYNCSKVADKYNIPACADGGLRYPGDITIAIGGGASSVMLGSMLAGTKEAPGDMIFHQGMQYKVYRGMGSISAMEKYKGSRERYSQSGKDRLIPEGIDGMVPYKGKLEEVIHQYTGGLRRGMGYVGAKDIKELREKADFVRITEAGKSESHPHDIIITRDAPNYPRR